MKLHRDDSDRSTQLRIDVVDYSGHPFQVELSRSLARRGHAVRHLYCSDYTSGKGDLTVRADDPAGFTVQAVSLGRSFDRYDVGARLGHEIQFGRELSRIVSERRPDIVMLCNVPLVAHFLVSLVLRARRIPQIFWLQDIYSRAIRSRMRARLGWVGLKLGGFVLRAEALSARNSGYVVAITEDFWPWTRRWGVPDAKVAVIPNWAPLAELQPTDRANPWAVEHDLVGRPVALYSGTLGLKHDPEVLLRLAHWARRCAPETRIVVVTEGYGRDWLEQARGQPDELPQLVLLDFQPYDRLAQVLGAADILIVILEQQASVFSVPSKVLSYFCAGRAVFAVMPPKNLAARTIVSIGAGTVVPNQTDAVEREFADLLGDPARLAAAGRSARAYAEASFDIERITDEFLAVIDAVLLPRSAVREGKRRSNCPI